LTAVIEVGAVTSPDQWLLGAGANKVVAVNSPDDDDTTYISSAGNGQAEQYSTGPNSIPSGSTINSVSVYSRARKESGSGATWSVRLYLGASYTASSAHFFTTSYVSFTDVLSRPGGGTWTLADLSTVEVRFTGTGSTIPKRCSSLWLIVDYTPPSNTGQFFHLFS
jgi:hypothetical protein